eukprot:NODE_1096_length_1016_cov_67.953881_g1051_i0.p1 GENE.NODE_1096_length_1016_cov_67.953881_g1051_i0~~NODE_1096_length_1016_cov_67.953881_g1051_i0.p1  ORF type:complete len:307 (+),score=87.01 NODE_1096_length_1016_cov_67.953881_g1051_i0:86-922(+)
MKYLVAVDGSEASQHAIDYAAQLVKGEDSVWFYTSSKTGQVDDSPLAKGKAALSGKIPDTNVDGVGEAKTDPREGIVNFAKAKGVDAIIMGSRGQGIVKRALLGSVSTDVLHNSEIPVVVVHHPQAEGANSWLVSVDGSECSNRSLEFAAKMMQSTCHVVLYSSFIPPPVMIAAGNVVARNPNYDSELKQCTQAAIELLNAAKAKLVATGAVPADNILEKVDAAFEPRQAVIDFASNNNIKTIVCGSRGHGAVKRFVFGSFSSHLIHEAGKHAILVVH